LGKANKNFFEGEVVHVASMHEKEELLRPLLSRAGLHCQSVAVNTDEFGTFSGEIERVGSIRETLRKKIKAAVALVPHGRLFLASEGTFGPHPILGFFQTDLEALLFLDQKLEIEIYAEFLAADVIHDEAVLGPRDDFRAFLAKIHFPSHGVIVRPEGLFNPIFKGLHEERSVAQAMLTSFMESKTGRVVLATDLRANHNPSRREAIKRAGENLLEKLLSLCPNCQIPGFAIARGIPGLKCSGCGEHSVIAKSVLLECVRCDFSEERPRPDGKTSIEPEECEHCNP
jgi:hypothetical protein